MKSANSRARPPPPGSCTLPSPVTLGEVVNGAATLIDIRNPGEREGGAVPAALRIPLAQVRLRVDEVPTDKADRRALRRRRASAWPHRYCAPTALGEYPTSSADTTHGPTRRRRDVPARTKRGNDRCVRVPLLSNGHGQQRVLQNATMYPSEDTVSSSYAQRVKLAWVHAAEGRAGGRSGASPVADPGVWCGAAGGVCQQHRRPGTCDVHAVRSRQGRRAAGHRGP